MLKTIFFSILFMLHLSLFAQKNVTGVINYGHKQSFGMGAPIGVDYNAELVFDAISSTYTFAKDSLEGGYVKKSVLINGNDDNFFFLQKVTTNEGFTYNLNTKSQLIKSRDIGFNYVKDTIPKITWKILDETKRIGNFECYKATCNFRGRNYTAWFSLSIPLPFGPWKLQGLPGLILEAYDTDKEVYFYFKSIEYPSKKELKITIPKPETNMDMERIRPTTKREWITAEDFKKEMIERHKIGTKMGRMLMEQSKNQYSIENKNPMRNIYIEIFDEE